MHNSYHGKYLRAFRRQWEKWHIKKWWQAIPLKLSCPIGVWISILLWAIYLLRRSSFYGQEIEILACYAWINSIFYFDLSISSLLSVWVFSCHFYQTVIRFCVSSISSYMSGNLNFLCTIAIFFLLIQLEGTWIYLRAILTTNNPLYCDRICRRFLYTAADRLI